MALKNLLIKDVWYDSLMIKIHLIGGLPWGNGNLSNYTKGNIV